ncbi:MAG: porin family protein [Muribaculum sp.]|nr:porin family protein [Muribaculaceae bacterium]MCM1081014.1 porin family protein [Muribaculum sp.]
MKKILTLAIVLIATLTASAEGWYAGGNVGFNRNTTDNKTGVIIMPEVGYNFTERAAIGATLGYEHQYNDGLKLDLVKISPYLRYTYAKIGMVDLFIDGGVDVGIGHSKAYGDGGCAVVWGIGLKPGVAFNINEKFSLVAHIGYLGYQGANKKARNVGEPNSFGFGLDGNDISLGFYYKF